MYKLSQKHTEQLKHIKNKYIVNKYKGFSLYFTWVAGHLLLKRNFQCTYLPMLFHKIILTGVYEKKGSLPMKIIMQHLSKTLPDKIELKNSLSQNRIQVVFAIILSIGVACGALFSRTAGLNTLKKLDFLFNSNYTMRSGTPALSVFVASAASSFIFIFVCFLCGLSVWGAFFAPLVPMIRGTGLGMTAGYLYATYGFHGGLFYAVVLLPGAYCSCIAILLAAKEALIFSRKLSSAGLSERGEAPKFVNYLSQFVRVLALAFLGAGLDVLCSWIFAGSIISWL